MAQGGKGKPDTPPPRTPRADDPSAADPETKPHATTAPDSATTPDPWLREGRVLLAGMRPRPQDRRRQGGARGPAKIAPEGPFFNPAMRFARDLTILALEARALAHPQDHTYTVYDGLAASGIRGLRIAAECAPGRALRVTLNDRDPKAHASIDAHIAANGLAARATATAGDFARAPAGARFDHVDVDPFGSPAPFLDAAIQLTRPRGTLALTATDMTALCGVYPRVCRRRYDAGPWHGPGMHEVALRILIGAAVRHAARFDRALRPLLAHSTDHFIRVYLESRTGAQRADAALAQIGYAVEGPDGTRRVVPRTAGDLDEARRVAGPLWIGPLHDADFIAATTERLSHHPQLEARPLEVFLERAREEADAPALVYELGELGAAARTGPPPMADLVARLRARGHQVARTHTSPTGLKTDAHWEALVRAFRG